ncbi:DUF445 domain-containing protein [Sporichthya sp.]|uniref:DUF445 domain-containing protein n=1 Tax=Sporichthya sp. TaxID=65475 RepID=UPI0017B25833|nr:DUF445 domain-containing protein [Sporichthya sp.]MBA3743627.1 DUF445 domain-containing protein [Sporichthya sp.]
MVITGVLGGYDDPVSRRRLRRMKLAATGLLAFAAALFLLTFALPENTATGYLQAAAEAGMVGGLADWFAVTALFRHPLGLPIPHTALVPKKKDDLATKLGEFVSGNFLTPDAVVERVREADPVRKVGERLLEPATADAVGRELSRAIAAVVGTLDDGLVSSMLLEHVRRDLDRRSYAREVGQLLATAVANRAQDPIVELSLPRLRAQLVANRVTVHRELSLFLDGLGMAARLWSTDRKVDKIIDRMARLLEEMERVGRLHPVRRQLDEVLERLADGLVNDPRAADGIDEVLRDIADNVAVEAWLRQVVERYLGSFRELLDNPTVSLEQQLGRIVSDLGRRMVDDPEFAVKIDRGLEQAVRYAVTNYADQVVALIRDQVSRWPAAEASSKIETAVGRDLQFIRINGTVVGALAGVAIYSVAVLAGHG